MRIFLNPAAGGGTSVSKWNHIFGTFRMKYGSPSTILLNGSGALERVILEALQQGETDFVAAGGDGTVNSIINILLRNVTPEQRERIRIGAIGLGSSNDFHKPFRPASMIGGIPCLLDFDSCTARDTGCITIRSGESFSSHYFLSNASIGLTAEANRFFNSPDHLLTLLKRFHTGLAIYYCAVREMFMYRNQPASIMSPGHADRSVNLTNLAVMKNPHVSGSLCYGNTIPVNDGLFRVYLGTEMNLADRAELFRSLSLGLFPRTRKSTEWTTDALTVAAAGPFTVEFDGETSATTFAQFRVFRQFLRVCQC